MPQLPHCCSDIYRVLGEVCFTLHQQPPACIPGTPRSGGKATTPGARGSSSLSSCLLPILTDHLDD